MKIYNIAIVAAAFMMTACQKDNSPLSSNNNYPEDGIVRVSTIDNGLQTKAEPTNTPYSGDSLGLSISYGDGDAYTKSNIFWSTIDGGSTWSPKDQMLWKDASTKASIFAYAPYDDSYTDLTNFSFSVQEDQSSNDALINSDLVTFSNTSYIPDDDLNDNKAIDIAFQHKMSQLVINFTNGNQYDDHFTNYQVYVNAKKTADYTRDNSGENITATNGTESDITANTDIADKTSKIIIVPQTIVQNIKFIKLTMNDNGNTYYLKVPTVDGYTFESGKSYTLNVRIGKDTLALDNNIKVGAWDTTDTEITGGDAEDAEKIRFVDANFEAAVIKEAKVEGYTVFDTVTKINVSNYEQRIALAKIKNLEISQQSISDVNGLEYLTGLKLLSCNKNNLNSINISKNTELTTLMCESNNLSVLDVSKNTALYRLDCNSNNLSVLDVSKNTALYRLDCNSNNLSVLDVSKNTALYFLECSINNLSVLDVSKNTELTELYCGSNNLSVLDVSKNTALTELDCYYNKLSTLDVSKNTKLQILDCSNNHLDTLDFTKNTISDYSLFCGDQKDENGNNKTITLYLLSSQLERWNVIQDWQRNNNVSVKSK